MAEGFGNETPDNPGYSLFAEDLVNFVMLRKSPRYTEEKKLVPISTLFHIETIQQRFSDALRTHALLNQDYIKHILGHVAVNSSGYTSTINSLEEILFDKGFTDNCFLNYCVHISTFAALFYNEGVDTAPEIAKSHIVNVLKNRMPAANRPIYTELLIILSYQRYNCQKVDSNV